MQGAVLALRVLNSLATKSHSVGEVENRTTPVQGSIFREGSVHSLERTNYSLTSFEQLLAPRPILRFLKPGDVIHSLHGLRIDISNQP
jgi:hypothetical protein